MININLLIGDCLERMKELKDNSVDSVITDPPYGLKFMNKHWDHSVPSVAIWKEVLRVLKPGAHLLSFGGTRTYHRLVVAIEDAGFEIRDQLQWIYGSGFPKSMDVSKAIDRAAGSPAATSAKQWQGWGTALKPANEPIVVARKPLGKGLTVAANVQKYGTGGLNIDASRVKADWANDPIAQGQHDESKAIKREMPTQGRWPANVILDEEAGQALDAQSGIGKPKPARGGKGLGFFDDEKSANESGVWPADQGGGASRFFYCPKASTRERNAGLDEMPTQVLATSTGQTRPGNPARLGADPYAVQEPVANYHPTVKPIALMEYLIRMVTPPNGIVLDPFMGSGSTGVAAKNLGFNFIGCEISEEYMKIAEARIREALK